MFPNGNADTRAGVGDGYAAVEPLGRFQRDAAHDAGCIVLNHLHVNGRFGLRDQQGFQRGFRAFVKPYVEHRSDDSDDASGFYVIRHLL